MKKGSRGFLTCKIFPTELQSSDGSDLTPSESWEPQVLSWPSCHGFTYFWSLCWAGGLWGQKGPILGLSKDLDQMLVTVTREAQRVLVLSRGRLSGSLFLGDSLLIFMGPHNPG